MSRPCYLALDTASPVVSLAVGHGDEILAARRLELRRSSEQLLASLNQALAEAGLELQDLSGLAVLRGPGSFTGLRVGLATVLGLHEATALPATGLSSLAAIATAAAGDGDEITAVVDALRGDWFAQRFARRGEKLEPMEAASLRSSGELLAKGTAKIAGFGLAGLAAEAPPGLVLQEPPPLAAAALRLASDPDLHWEATLLTRPIYFRAPAVTVAARA